MRRRSNECAFQHEMKRMWKIVNHSHLCHPLWNASQRVKLHTHISDLVDQFIVFCYPLTSVYSPTTQQNRDWHWSQQTHRKSWASPRKCQRTSVISEHRESFGPSWRVFLWGFFKMKSSLLSIWTWHLPSSNDCTQTP